MSVCCFILEDQAPARRILENYLARLPGFDVVGSAAAPSTAANILDAESIDLLFLDLGLPQQDGFDFLQTRDDQPVVIVTTAFAIRAVEGYTHGVADYLVKPFAFERFKTATERALMALRAKQDDTIITIPIDRGLREFVPARNTLSVSAYGDYVQLRTAEKALLTLGPLSKWVAQLPSPPFVRIHRSHIVNCDCVTSASSRNVDIHGESLPISSTYAAELNRALDMRTLRNGNEIT